MKHANTGDVHHLGSVEDDDTNHKSMFSIKSTEHYGDGDVPQDKFTLHHVQHSDNVVDICVQHPDGSDGDFFEVDSIGIKPTSEELPYYITDESGEAGPYVEAAKLGQSAFVVA